MNRCAQKVSHVYTDEWYRIITDLNNQSIIVIGNTLKIGVSKIKIYAYEAKKEKA